MVLYVNICIWFLGLICDRGLTLGDLIGVLYDFFSRLGNKLGTECWLINVWPVILERKQLDSLDALFYFRHVQATLQARL